MRAWLSIICAMSMVAACATGSEVDEASSSAEPAVEQAEAAPDFRAGIYAGTYVCARGENGLTLSLDTFEAIPAAMFDVNAVSARLWFYDTANNPDHPSGAFMLSGLAMSGQLDLEPGEWLSEVPENWGAAGISGRFVVEGDEVYIEGKPSGPGTSACEPFRLKRLGGLGE